MDYAKEVCEEPLQTVKFLWYEMKCHTAHMQLLLEDVPMLLPHISHPAL